MKMSRCVAFVALLALFALHTHAAETEQPYVYNTVTAVAHIPEYATTIKIFVETPKCAVDNKIFLQDFLTCDFSWVEDLAENAPEISAPTCPRSCAVQWAKITPACYDGFRNRMEASKVLGEYAKKFFSRCDVHAKVTVGEDEEATDKPATGAGNKPTGTVSATDIDGTPATSATGSGATNTPGAATTPTAAGTPDSAEETVPAANADDEEGVETPAAATTPVPDTDATTTDPEMGMPDDVSAEAGAEAPSAADAPSAGPAAGPVAAPGPAQAPAVAAEPTSAPEATSLPSSSATTASAKYAVLALLGLTLMML